MPNNTGLIFGRVTSSSGGGAVAGAEVSLNFVFGEASLGQLRVAGDDNMQRYVGKAETNGDGKYVLPFFWDSVDIGKVTEGATASVLAMKFFNDGTYNAKNQRGRLVLTLDIKKLLAAGGYSAPSSAPDAANLAKDLFAGFKGMLPDHRTFYPSSPLLSTEVFGLLGRIDIAM
jgi:hypothetical protein